MFNSDELNKLFSPLSKACRQYHASARIIKISPDAVKNFDAAIANISVAINQAKTQEELGQLGQELIETLCKPGTIHPVVLKNYLSDVLLGQVQDDKNPAVNDHALVIEALLSTLKILQANPPLWPDTMAYGAIPEKVFSQIVRKYEIKLSADRESITHCQECSMLTKNSDLTIALGYTEQAAINYINQYSAELKLAPVTKNASSLVQNLITNLENIEEHLTQLLAYDAEAATLDYDTAGERLEPINRSQELARDLRALNAARLEQLALEQLALEQQADEENSTFNH